MQTAIRKTIEARMPDPEIRAKASSHFTADTIDNRLAVLRERSADDSAALAEIDYLMKLRARKFGA